MTLKTSTGLVNAMMATGSFRDVFDGNGYLVICQGTEPATADASLNPANILCTITENGEAGAWLHLNTAAAAGVLGKLTGETWAGLPSLAGTATYFRYVLFDDTHAASALSPRVQGTVGTTGSFDLVLPSTTLTTSASVAVSAFTVTLPPS